MYALAEEFDRHADLLRKEEMYPAKVSIIDSCLLMGESLRTIADRYVISLTTDEFNSITQRAIMSLGAEKLTYERWLAESKSYP